MKSAYERAMERFASEESDSKPLTDAQKAELKDIDERFKAKIAEREIFLSQKRVEAQSRGEFSEVEAINKQLVSEKSRLEEEKEFQKNKVRNRS